jgi:hypothetical protein
MKIPLITSSHQPSMITNSRQSISFDTDKENPQKITQHSPNFMTVLNPGFSGGIMTISLPTSFSFTVVDMRIAVRAVKRGCDTMRINPTCGGLNAYAKDSTLIKREANILIVMSN